MSHTCYLIAYSLYLCPSISVGFTEERFQELRQTFLHNWLQMVLAAAPSAQQRDEEQEEQQANNKNTFVAKNMKYRSAVMKFVTN